jgi:hypothetical protein
MAKAAPANAAEPSGSTLTRRAQSAEALAIAVEHADVSEEVMGEQHRLGALEVSVPGHWGLRVPLGLVEERRLHGLQRRVEVAEHVAEVEALVESDLVVARAPRVELPAHLARDLDEPALDVHVDVSSSRRKVNCRSRAPRARPEALVDEPPLHGVDEPRALERPRPRARCRGCRGARAAGRRTAKEVKASAAGRPPP